MQHSIKQPVRLWYGLEPPSLSAAACMDPKVFYMRAPGGAPGGLR